MKRTALVSGAAAALVVTAVACSSGTSGSYGSSGSSGTSNPPSTSAPPSATAPNPASAGTITIAGFTFTGPLTVPAGATVTVTNSDSAPHTVTGDSPGQFDVRVPAGQTVTFTAPATAGTYKYHCAIHPDMHGTLIVG